MLKSIITTFILITTILIPTFSLASTTNGTIQNQYAWGENTGWVNFLPTDGNIHITNTAITGYAWDPNYGWINFAPTESGVVNDGNGNLSGYAWSQGAGYINFSGVVINSSGKFTGIASGATYGQLTFDCDQCNVTTDWRPTSASSVTTSSSGGRSIFGTSIDTSVANVSSTVDNISNWVTDILAKPDVTQINTTISASTSTSTQYLNQTEKITTPVNNKNTSSGYKTTFISIFIVILIIVTLRFLIVKI